MGRFFVLIGAGLLLGACAAQPKTEMALRYCYRTLAAVDCHAQVLPGEEFRRVGYFDAPVAP